MYKVIIAEDEVFVRTGYKTLIGWQALGMEVAADVANGQEAYDAYLRIRPDIVVTDLRMPVMDGLALIRRIRQKDARTRVLIITCLDEFEMVREALELGVSGYVLKLEANVEDLEAKLAALKKELDGQGAPPIPFDPNLPAPLNGALAYIESAYAHDIALTDVAERIGVTPNYLSRLFARHLNSSFTASRNAVRVRHAARILEEGTDSVRAVGMAVGFTNDTYFIRVFKQHTGVTPDEFRRSRQQQALGRGTSGV